MIVVMGLITAMVLALAMMLSLGQFQEIPAADWVKLSESLTNEFKVTNVAVRVNLTSQPTQMKISYASPNDSKFDLSVQNAEMERVAAFAVKAYRGKDANMIDQVAVTRSETHGSGCFKQTYTASVSVPTPRRSVIPGNPFGAPPPRDR
jgi:hypothetical protein